MHTIHRLQKIVCLLLFSLSSLSAFAQASTEKHYLFTHYNTQNGLLNNVIFSMVQDRQGYIWIGSDLGLTRFDGKTFYHNAIPDIYDNSAFVQIVKTSHEGRLLCFAAMQGIFEQMEDGTFKNYAQQPKIIGRNMFEGIKQGPDGKIFAVSALQLFRLEGDSLTVLYHHGMGNQPIFSAMDIDRSNTIWFGGSGGIGTLEPSGSEYKPVFFPELKDVFTVHILLDTQGVLHVGTARGYYRIVFKNPGMPNSEYTISQPFEEVNSSYINHIYSDNEQNIWISTSGHGTYRTKGDSITLHLSAENGLLASGVMCVMQDREGSYWFGTSGGISMVENFNSYMLAKEGKLFQNTSSMGLDKYGRIWIYDREIFHIYQSGQIIPLALKNTPLTTGIVKSAIDDQSVMWMANYFELFRMPLTEQMPDLKKAEKVADFSIYNPSNIRPITTDTNGVWLYTRTQVLHYHHKRLLPVTFNFAEPTNIRPVKIIQDRFGHYWLGDYTYGLYRATLTENTKEKIVFDHIKTYKSLNPDVAFVTAYIQDLEIDKEGNLWEASMYTGAYKHRLDSSGVVSSKLYSVKNGLLSNVVTGISCEADGRVWFFTQNGICILTQDADGGEHFDYLNEKDGIKGQSLNIIEQDGRFFTLTDEALYVTPNSISADAKREIPPVVITGLSVNGVDYTAWVLKNKPLTLTHSQNNLSFDFSSIVFKRAENVHYQYNLEGSSKEWSNLSDRGFVEYSALIPGKYIFKVRAAMDDETFGDTTSLTFKINSVYYQTIWFYLLALVLISTLAYFFYKNRINHVIKTERLRSRIASDLHDDIGSTLSSIFLMSEMAGSSDKQSRLAEALHKISANSRDILNSMDDIIWSVNPQDDSLTNLMVRLREYAIPVCEARDIVLSMNIDETTAGTKLGMDERRNIFLITKEAINNAVKHSGCNKLEVTFAVRHKQIEVSVIDNGRGFDPQAPSSRNGLVNMQRRARQIEGEWQLDSEKGRGTSVVLRVKNHIFI